MYQLVDEWGSVIHEGTKSECELILKAFETYGVRPDKFEIVPARPRLI